MEAYCARQSLQMNQIRFLFKGNRLHDNQTPDELEMEDDDVIDAQLAALRRAAMSDGESKPVKGEGGDKGGAERINLKVKRQVLLPPRAVASVCPRCMPMRRAGVFLCTLLQRQPFVLALGRTATQPIAAASSRAWAHPNACKAEIQPGACVVFWGNVTV